MVRAFLHRAANGVASLAVRRRTGLERRVLLLLRGGGTTATIVSGGPQPRRDRRLRSDSADHFAQLRHLATIHGLAILPPAAPYMSGDEVLLLGWIAQAQRVVSPTLTMPRDRALVAVVVRCAEALDAGGLRLTPLTIYSACGIMAT